MPSQRATVYLTPETLRILGDGDSLSGLINAMAQREEPQRAALALCERVLSSLPAGDPRVAAALAAAREALAPPTHS